MFRTVPDRNEKKIKKLDIASIASKPEKQILEELIGIKEGVIQRNPEIKNYFFKVRFIPEQYNFLESIYDLVSNRRDVTRYNDIYNRFLNYEHEDSLETYSLSNNLGSEVCELLNIPQTRRDEIKNKLNKFNENQKDRSARHALFDSYLAIADGIETELSHDIKAYLDELSPDSMDKAPIDDVVNASEELALVTTKEKNCCMPSVFRCR